MLETKWEMGQERHWVRWHLLGLPAHGCLSPSFIWGMVTWKRAESVIYVNNEKEMWDIYDSILQSGAYSSEISTGQTCLTELYLNLKERGINLHFITGW